MSSCSHHESSGRTPENAASARRGGPASRPLGGADGRGVCGGAAGGDGAAGGAGGSGGAAAGGAGGVGSKGSAGGGESEPPCRFRINQRMTPAMGLFRFEGSPQTRL